MKMFCIALLACFLMASGFAAFSSAADGKALYAKCSGCHGADGAKVAPGSQKALKGMSADEAGKALTGYKAGTFGGEKKAMMEGMVKSLAPEDIEALAQYIGKF